MAADWGGGNNSDREVSWIEHSLVVVDSCSYA